MTVLLPKIFQRLVDQRGNVDTSFYRWMEDVTAAINAGVGGVVSAATATLKGTGWIEVEKTADGYEIRLRGGLSTNDIPEGVRRYANQTAAAYNFATEAGVVLEREHYRNAFLEMTDSGTVLTTGQDVEFPDEFPLLLFKNSTAQTLTLKKNGQTGVTVAAGAKAVIAPGLTDVEKA